MDQTRRGQQVGCWLALPHMHAILVQTRHMITQHVSGLAALAVAPAAILQEDDLGQLEERIRARLSGETPK